ncbi:MAG: glycosyltransferase family 2 protein, partial [Nitrospirae bacterium]|nr:glycosyltransferase family 2 protein [Nitrospirota bacterium]
MKVALLIPTFNEIVGLRQIMPMIKREWVDEIVFVDGNSTDGSIEYIRENNYT